MKNTKDYQLARAREMALQWLNKNRAEKGYAPLKRLEIQWWKIYGREWLDKAAAK